MNKFHIGDIVQIREDLVLGQVYYNENSPIGDTFTSSMRKNRGKKGRIIDIHQGKYMLDIDVVHGYTDSMLMYPKDDLADSEYLFNPEVEKLIIHMEALYLEKLIDEAIDNGDKDRFMELTEEYKKKKFFLEKVV
jgi:hypothetical protein